MERVTHDKKLQLPGHLQSSDCLTVLETVCRNILKYPCDERFRRIRVGCASFQTLCAGFGGQTAAVEFAMSLGFAAVEEPSKGLFLVFAPTTRLDSLRECLDLIDRQREVVEAGRRAAVEEDLALRHDEATRARDAAVLALQQLQGGPTSISRGASALANIILSAIDSDSLRKEDWEAFCKNHPTVNQEAIVLSERDFHPLDGREVGKVQKVIGLGPAEQLPKTVLQDVASLVDSGLFERQAEQRKRLRPTLQQADRTARRSNDKESAPPCTVSRELQLTATQLVNDIAALMEQCEVLTGTSGLVRKDRLRARELLAAVSSDEISIDSLHDMVAEWTRRLDDVKKSMGRSTVFLE